MNILIAIGVVFSILAVSVLAVWLTFEDVNSIREKYFLD